MKYKIKILFYRQKAFLPPSLNRRKTIFYSFILGIETPSVQPQGGAPPGMPQGLAQNLAKLSLLQPKGQGVVREDTHKKKFSLVVGPLIGGGASPTNKQKTNLWF